MIYGSIRVHVGPCGPIWVATGEKSNVKNVKIIISDSDFYPGILLFKYLFNIKSILI